MGRNIENEMARRGAGTLAIPEPKKLISRRGDESQTKPTQPEKEKEGPIQLPLPVENKPLANLNRLKEFNGIFESSRPYIGPKPHKEGRKAERLRESSERIRLYLVDSLRKAGIRIDWQCGFSGIQSTWETVRGQLWREREHMNVMQIQESVRLMTSRLFELPSDGWKELETALENLRHLKSI
jgi:hypothetical protein